MRMSDPSPTSRWFLAGVLLNRDARWITPHLWRGGFLVALFLPLSQAAAGMSRSAAPGLQLLESLTWVSAFGLVALAVAGVGSLFRDEWVGNNWELLQLTGISGFELLLAKLIPAWFTAASLLLLEIPVFLLCVTLGGVTSLQVWAVVWQLAWLFLMVSAATVVVASGFRKTSSILIATLALVFIAQITEWTIQDILSQNIYRIPLGGSNQPRCVFIAEFNRIFTSGFAGPIFGWATCSHALVVAGLVGLASMNLRTKLTDTIEPDSVEETAPEGQAHRTNIPVWRPSYRVPRIMGNAIEWKDYHFTLGGDEMMTGKWGLLTLAVVLLGLLWLIVAVGETDFTEFSIAFLAPGMFLALMGAIGSLTFSAGRLWIQELRERTLDGLMLLPFKPEEILHAKLRVLIKMSLPETALCMLLLLLIIWFSFAMRDWTLCGLYAGLLLSIPMVVCTDAAWRFLPKTFAGTWPRTQLAGMDLLVWCSSGCVAYFLSPLLGLLLLAVLVPVMCRFAIRLAAESLRHHAGELAE